MPIRSKLHAAIAAAAVSGFFVVGIPAASAYQCEDQVTQVLQQHNVSQSDVESVEVVRRTGGAKSAGIYSLDAWVRLNSCSNGALVVHMTKYCMVQDSYTTGDCTSDNMRSY